MCDNTLAFCICISAPAASASDDDAATATHLLISQIELQLEVVRRNKEFSTPFQCWCNAYGAHQTVESRRATLQFTGESHTHTHTQWIGAGPSPRRPVPVSCSAVLLQHSLQRAFN